MTSRTPNRRTRRGTPPPHGERRRYAYWGCRCPGCREANRLYDKRHREGRAAPLFTDSVGTERRTQALVAAGWGYAAVAARMGCRPEWVRQLTRIDRSRGVLTRTADQVRWVYDELTALPPPTGRSATYARTVAARYGWLPPLAWDDNAIDDPAAQPATGGTGQVVDEVAIARALRGEQIRLTRLERHHAVHAGRDRGVPFQRLADVLRLSHVYTRELAGRPLPADDEAAVAA